MLNKKDIKKQLGERKNNCKREKGSFISRLGPTVCVPSLEVGNKVESEEKEPKSVVTGGKQRERVAGMKSRRKLPRAKPQRKQKVPPAN